MIISPFITGDIQANEFVGNPLTKFTKGASPCTGWWNTRRTSRPEVEIRLWWNGEIWIADPKSPPYAIWTSFHQSREWQGIEL